MKRSTYTDGKIYGEQGISRKEYALAITESILLVFLIAMLFYSRLWMMAVLFPLGMKYYERMIRQAEEKGKRCFERQFQDALQSLEAQTECGILYGERDQRGTERPADHV